MPLAMANCVSTVFAIAWPPIGESVGRCQLDAVCTVDTHDAREPGVLGNGVNGVLEQRHLRNLARQSGILLCVDWCD